jgi:RND family efflux transporter MFP subunit
VLAEKKNVPVYSELIGRTVSVKTAEVRPQVSGVILKRLFVEGSQVQAGQQLYQIDPAIYDAQLASAKAELAKAEANLYNAKLKYERYQELIKTHSISRQELDDSHANFLSAQASKLAAQAAVKTAQINLNYTKVYAPISGIIGKSNVTEGALVTNGQMNELATIHQIDPMNADLGQSVTEYLAFQKTPKENIKNLNEVTLFLENNLEYENKGKLSFSEVTVDETTGMVNVRVSVPNPNNVLLPGMFVKAKILQGQKKDSILIPQIAVMRQTNGTSIVYTITDKNCPPNIKECVSMKVIDIVGEDGDKYIIKSEIKEGDKIITSNLQKTGPGAPITPIPPTNN